MSKHTPGPWRLDLTSPYKPGDITPYAQIDGGTGYWVHQGEPGFHLSGVMAAEDAHLIVAAPDMLGALRTAERAFHAYDRFHDDRMAIEAIRSAIAKAEGGAK